MRKSKILSVITVLALLFQLFVPAMTASATALLKETVIAEMTTEDKIAQMLMPTFRENSTKRRGWLHFPTPFDQWYYLGSDGYMVKGWQKINGKTYFFNRYGVMKTGWQKIDGKWYYFNASGAMRTEDLTENGTVYHFSKSGACLNP